MKILNIPESTKVFDPDEEEGKPVKSLLVIREGQVAISTQGERYGFFGDLHTVQSRMLYALAMRLMTDRAWVYDMYMWLKHYADSLESQFRKDASNSSYEEKKKEAIKEINDSLPDFSPRISFDQNLKKSLN